MKKIIALAGLILALCLHSNLYSQENKDIYSYCQLVGTSNLLGTKVTVVIDYGQERKWNRDNRLKTESGEVIKFNSMIDAFNFMALRGWEHVQAYAVTIGNSNVYHHLLKRKVEQSDEILEKE